MQNTRKKVKARKPTRVPSSGLARIERMEHPIQINGYNLTHMTRLRFTVVAAANVVITFANLLDSVLIATTAIAGFDLFDIVRVKSVEIWSQAALGTPSTITVAFATATGDRSIHTDTSLGVKPAYVKAVPSEKSLASFWTSTGGGNCFSLRCPAGSIIDCSLELRTTDAVATAAAAALVGATIGELYYRGLDGLAIAGSNIPPIAGVPSI